MSFIAKTGDHNVQPSTVLAWLQTQLSIYIELNLITFEPDLSNTITWLGKPIFCLAHRFFPDAFQHQDFLVEFTQSSSYSKAISLFQERLNISYEETNLETFFSQIQTAIEQQQSMDTEVRELYVGLNDTAKMINEQETSDDIQELLIAMKQLYYECFELIKPDTLSNSSSTTRSSSPRIIGFTTIEDLQLPIQTRLLQEPSCLEDIERQFNKLEIKFKSLQQSLITTTIQVHTHPNLATRLSTLYATHAVLQAQLHKGLQHSMDIEFSTNLANIRNELDFIQAKMIKTTTTDTSIHDLEVRSTKVSSLIHQLDTKYHRDTQQQQHQFDLILEKHQLVAAWVNEIRVWFMEAERIRTWIKVHVEKLEENKMIIDALEQVEFDYTLEQIQIWNADQNELKNQVEKFDIDNVSKLRAHVKALTGIHTKDLSPADTTTIEITFTTLMTLDRLLHLLQRRSYELQILTLRMTWEQSYHSTIIWIRSTTEQVKLFIQQKARWKPTDQDKQQIMTMLSQFEKDISTFDQDQFTTTVNCYQDLDDACHVELPTHLESRQVAIEEAFQELTNRLGFARQIVDQNLVVTEFSSKAEQLKSEGELLRQEMITAESKANVNINEFNERVSLFQENVVRLVTGVTSRIPYPDAVHPADQQGNEESNETIRMTVGVRKSALVLFSETLDHDLNTLRRAIQLQKRAKQLGEDMNRLTNWIEERLKAGSNMDAFVTGKCALDDDDISRLYKERDGQVAKLNGIKENDLVKLQDVLQSLSHSSSTYHPNNSNISTQIHQLQNTLDHLIRQISVLESVLMVHSQKLDLLNKRISWESQHTKAILWISNITFEIWDFVTRKAQWRMSVIMDEDRNDIQWEGMIMDEWKDLENKIQAFEKTQLSNVSNTFIQFKNDIVLPEIMAQENTDSLMITVEQLERRQNTLDQNFNSLHDLILYAEQVIAQHSALTGFTCQVNILKSKGHQLVLIIQNALNNIMGLDKETEYPDMVSDVKSFGQSVIQLWMESGSHLPYPQCPEDARSTRPSTNDDEISSEIATCVYKMYNELQELVKKLADMIQHLDLAMLYRFKIEKWCQDARDTVDDFRAFTSKILLYDFKLPKGIIYHQNQLVSIDHCQEKQKEFSIQLNENNRKLLLGELVSLKEAECHVVNISITQEPFLELDESWNTLSDTLVQFNKQLSICEARQVWHKLWTEQYELLNNLQDSIREWNNQKNLWVSKYDNDYNNVSKEELDTIINQCHLFHQTLQTYASQDQPKLIEKHALLTNAFHSMNTIEDPIVLGIEEQVDIKKLFVKLTESITHHLSEIDIIQKRYAWESNVDHQIKACVNRELEIETLIDSNARWSLHSDKINQNELNDLHQLTMNNIDSLINNQPQISTESIFCHKTRLLNLKTRLEQQKEYLDQVVQQHQVITNVLAEFDSMESKASNTKSEFLSSNVPLFEKLETHKRLVLQVCQSADAKMIYPMRDYQDHDEKDTTHNKSIKEMIKVRQSQLLETGNTLETILRSKERLSRRKAAETSYLAEANAVELWIKNQSKQIQEATSLDDLKNAVSLINTIQSAIETYTSVNGLEVAASKYIALIQQQQGDDDAHEVLNSVELINQKQQSIMDAWETLSLNALQTQKSLLFDLNKMEFFNLVACFKSQCKKLEDKVNNTQVPDISEEVSLAWQNELEALEAIDIKSKVQDVWTFHYQEVIEQYQAIQHLVQARTEEAKHHRLKATYFKNAHQLESIISNIKQQLTHLISQPVVIQGCDLEQDKKILEKISGSFSSIYEAFDGNQETYDEHCSFYRFLHLNEIPDLVQVDERQQVLEKEWKELKSELTHQKQHFIASLSQWFELHVKLNDIKEQSLDDMVKRLHEFKQEEIQTIPAFFEQDAALLSLIHHLTTACLDTATAIPENDINRSHFKAKYDMLLSEIQAAEQLFDEKKQLAQLQLDFISCQKSVQNICKHVMDEIEAINTERITSIDDADEVDVIYEKAMNDFTKRESIQQSIHHEIHLLLQQLEKHQDKDVLILQLSNAQSDLNHAIQETSLVNDSIKRVMTHQNSARHILSWLDNYQSTITNLDEAAMIAQVEHLTKKLNEFEKDVNQFQELSSTITRSNDPWKDMVEPKINQVNQQWTCTVESLEKVKKTVDQAMKGAMIARKIKHIVSLIGEMRSQVNSISLYDDDNKDNDNQKFIASMPRLPKVEEILESLQNTESELQPQIDTEMQELKSYIDDEQVVFSRQYNELEDAIMTLKEIIKEKYASLEKSLAIGSFLTAADQVEALQASLEEIIHSSTTSSTSTLSRTEIHTKMIDMDTRFKYHEQNITQGLVEIQEKANQVKIITPTYETIVDDHIKELHVKWDWIKKQFKTRKIELSRSIVDSKEKDIRFRKSSLPTKKASSLLRDRADGSSKQRLSTKSRLPQLLTQPSKSATNLKSKPQVDLMPPPNSYVADPDNDLDIEIGRIVNEAPYRVQVKMVPGEVGRYWFGNLNPKLCYCRVLKSKMVMVRVGGGWTELSQFLRDHTLLEGDFIPYKQSKKNSGSLVIPEEDDESKKTVQEGFIETRRDNNTIMRRHQSNNKSVTGSPSHSTSTQTGYKEGDRYIAVDIFGVPHQVQMRKVTSHSSFVSHSSSTSTNTNSSSHSTHLLNDYTKKRIARRNEKKKSSNNNTENTQ